MFKTFAIEAAAPPWFEPVQQQLNNMQLQLNDIDNRLNNMDNRLNNMNNRLNQIDVKASRVRPYPCLLTLS